MNEQQKALQQIANLTSAKTISSLGEVISQSQFDTIPDNELGDYYLFSQRRIALQNVLEKKIQYEEASAAMTAFNESKVTDATKMQELTNNLNNSVQVSLAWQVRLQAILKLTSENAVMKIIAENYVNVSPTQGVKSKAKNEGLSEEEEPKRKPSKKA